MRAGVLLLAAVAVTAGCGLAGQDTDSVSLKRFTGYGLTFAYPAGWHAKAGDEGVSASLIVTLRTFRVPGGCEVGSRCWVFGRGSVIHRRVFSHHRLPPHSAVVMWLEEGGMLSVAMDQPKKLRLSAPRSGGCPTVADRVTDQESFTGAIGTVRAYVCLHGPGLPTLRREVYAMFKSLRTTTDP